MDVRLSMLVLAGTCGLVLLILITKKKAQFFLNFLLRAGAGVAMIIWVNGMFVKQGIGLSVGLNFWSLLTSGSLGIPGVALLFAISALQNL